ncbi:MAG: SDR family oxidoreductase [Burkholderiales bacterium]|nr:SDR family oxidoreductase [Burkholderiales bacterium]
MNILITGASGLVGSALTARLSHAGHHVTAVCRRPIECQAAGIQWLAGDMAHLSDAADWYAMLDGIDVVVNAVGIFRQHGTQTFANLHTDAPRALFEACVTCGVTRVVQVSALGASPTAVTEYWRSKGAADASLQTQPLDWVIVQPSLVYADEGVSSKLFRSLAALPFLVAPAQAGPVQPIHLDDLTELLFNVCTTDAANHLIIKAVGPRALAWSDYLAALREGMGMPRTAHLCVPRALMAGLAHLAGKLPGSLLNPASLYMLAAGSVADAGPIIALVGPMREPKNFAHPTLRADAVLAAWHPLIRTALVLLWLGTALVSVLSPQTSMALLAEAKVPADWMPVALYAGIALDTALGLATLLRPRRRLWRAQWMLVMAYTGIITAVMPAWWLHPFGPVLKNLPILVFLGLLDQLETDPPQTR